MERRNPPSGENRAPSGTSPSRADVKSSRLASISAITLDSSAGIQTTCAPRATALRKTECRVIAAKDSDRGRVGSARPWLSNSTVAGGWNPDFSMAASGPRSSIRGVSM